MDWSLSIAADCCYKSDRITVLLDLFIGVFIPVLWIQLQIGGFLEPGRSRFYLDIGLDLLQGLFGNPRII